MISWKNREGGTAYIGIEDNGHAIKNLDMDSAPLKI
jgi:hypothetical protein